LNAILTRFLRSFDTAFCELSINSQGRKHKAADKGSLKLCTLCITAVFALISMPISTLF